MMMFDASPREVHILTPTRTNTPLQALNLMNDMTYTEAARALAERAMTEGTTIDETVGYMYRLATAHEPEPETRSVLADAFTGHFDRYQADREAALLLVSVGESQRNEVLDITELAAYQMVASMILNLDATITRD